MLSYGFAYTEAAIAALEAIPKKAQGQVRRKIGTLANNPYPRGSKQLHDVMDGDNPVYRLRSGDYRILYSVRGGQTIAVLDIGNRKDVYRRQS